MDNKLSKKEYWNNNYANKVFLPVKVEPNSIEIFSLNEIFNKHLKLEENDSFIELGCAPGGWLYYFDRYFKLRISGVDYAEEGVAITKENMDILGIKASIFFSDIFNFPSEEKYKVVFSAGLIEHFKGRRLAEVISKHFELAEKNGYVIIIVPNFTGWNYFYQKLINKKNLDIHNLDVMSIDFFEKNIIKDRIEKKFLGYAGKINLGLYSVNNFLGYLHTILQAIINIAFFKFNFNFRESRRLSPYILAIYKVK